MFYNIVKNDVLIFAISVCNPKPYLFRIFSNHQ